jgi:predicted dehydrogenase
MRFALVGDHVDGLDMARALAESGRHELGVYCGSAVGAEYLRRWQLSPARVGDVEEVLADPAIEAVIVAGSPGDRPAQLRRALQSERHVLCVHPLDQATDTAFEAALIQADTGNVLVPLLPEALHPAIRQLAVLADKEGEADFLRLLEIERMSPEPLLLNGAVAGHKPSFPGWDVLRLVGGEVAELTALAAGEEADPDEPLVLAGRFERRGLFQIALIPGQAEARWRLTARTTAGKAELIFPQGWPGPAQLAWLDESGREQNSAWDTWNPWPALVEAFESELAGRASGRAGPSWGSKLSQSITRTPGLTASSGEAPRVCWLDEIRCLELDNAAHRSIERRRASTLEYQEATEEAGFKGTMTLVGCGLIWLSLVLLVLSIWLPWMGWLILPVFVFFLLLQLLRWVVPKGPA